MHHDAVTVEHGGDPAEKPCHATAWASRVPFALLALLALSCIGRPTPALAHAPAQSSAPRSGLLELSDQIGGTTRALAVLGEDLVVGLGPRVAVVRVAPDGVPRILGRSEVLPGIVEDLALGPDFAVVLCRQGEVMLLSLADRTRPELLGRLDSGLRGVPRLDGGGIGLIGEGHLAAFVARRALQVVDLSDPRAPVFMRPLPLPRGGRGLVVADDSFVLAAPAAAVEGSEALPELEILRFVEAETDTGLALEQRAPGGRLFVTARLVAADADHAAIASSGGLEIWDTRHDRRVFSRRLSVSRDARATFATGVLYIGSGSEPLIHVVAPTDSPHAWQAQEPIALPRAGRGHRVVVDGDRLFAAGGAVGALGWHVREGEARGFLRFDTGLGYIHTVAVGGCCAFTGGTTGWAVIDDTSPGPLRLREHHGTERPVAAISAWGRRFLVATHAVTPVADRQPVPRAILIAGEVEGPGAARVLNRIERSKEQAPDDIAHADGQALVSLADRRLLTVDLGPVPSVVDKVYTRERILDLDAYRGLVVGVYVDILNRMGLLWFQADPGGWVVGEGPRFGAPTNSRPSAAAHGELHLLADGSDLFAVRLDPDRGVEVVGQLDLPRAMPAGRAPRRVPGSSMTDDEVDVQVAAGHAWLAQGQAGVIVVDARLPDHLDFVAQTDTPGDARRLLVVGDRLFVADGEGGLLVLRARDVLPARSLWLPWVGRETSLRR